MSDRVQINFNITQAEKERLDTLAARLTNGNRSELLRLALDTLAATNNLPALPARLTDTRRDHWRGKWHQCPQCGGWNVGETDGVKACADCGWHETTIVDI